jgi:CheY-like chemotaxis protein
MLIDDNKDDNFFHERVIKKSNAADVVIAKQSGPEALKYLTTLNVSGDTRPNVIFLDINMPGMNGWEFIEEFKKLDKYFQETMVVVMLTTSDNPDDKALAKTNGLLAGFKTKPLTKEMLEDILKEYCKE